MINQIEAYYKKNGYPDFMVIIRPGVKIPVEAAKFFIDSSIETIKAHKNNQGYNPYYDHLKDYHKKVVEVRKLLKRS